MAVSFTHPGLHCPRVNAYVQLDQTEAQCRDAHNCGSAGKCPLENELGQSVLERTLATLLAQPPKG